MIFIYDAGLKPAAQRSSTTILGNKMNVSPSITDHTVPRQDLAGLGPGIPENSSAVFRVWGCRGIIPLPGSLRGSAPQKYGHQEQGHAHNDFGSGQLGHGSGSSCG